MNRKPLIYIAGPYTHPDPVANTRRAIAVGMSLFDRGRCAPLIPHLSLLAELVDPHPYEDWLRLDRDHLARCDAVYRLRGDSAGADSEVALAGQLDIPVFYEPDNGHLSELLLAWLDDRPTITEGHAFTSTIRQGGAA